jgi:hypothetical protein
MCLFEREKPSHTLKEADMRSHADGSVIIQTSAEAAPSTSSWFGVRDVDGCVSSHAWCSNEDQGSILKSV